MAEFTGAIKLFQVFLVALSGRQLIEQPAEADDQVQDDNANNDICYDTHGFPLLIRRQVRRFCRQLR